MRMILAFVTFAILCVTATAGDCYRPFQQRTTYVAPTYHAPAYVAPAYVEHYDRFYSLSDLIRERMYLELWDDYKSRSRYGKDDEEEAQPTKASARKSKPASPVVKASPTTMPPVKAEAPAIKTPLGKTTEAAAKVIRESCLSCHGAGHAKFDATNPDAVSLTTRWAAYGMAGVGDMPPPPKDLRAKGKEAELKKWKQEHAISEAALDELYAGWVQVKK